MDQQSRIRSDHLIVRLLTLACLINAVRGGFYIGEYKTASSSETGRNRYDQKGPTFHPNDSIDNQPESNQLLSDARSLSTSKRRQAVGFSTFNPLTPGGTIYLAFIFLIPLTVGKNLGRRQGSSRTTGLVERLIHKVQQDQQSLYSEMGYVDGNLMVSRAWRDIRHTLAQRILHPWRRRRNNNNKDKSLKNNFIFNNKNKYKKKKKKFKSWL